MSETSRFRSSRLMAALLAILAAGALFAWWTAARADRAMRADLLRQTRLVAQAVNVGRVQTLSGTTADLTNPDYLWLKEQLAAVRSVNPRCRFVYLMGRKADGTVFFFLDSEPAGSADHSPPGQVYEEVTPGLRGAFDAKAEVVEGPVTDRWGTWISALVPLTNPQTGAVVAVLGMDIDARTWKWDTARAALPVGLLLMLLISVAAALVFARRVDASPKPIMRRLLPPLAAVVVVLMLCAGTLLWQQHRRQLAETIADRLSEISRDLHTVLDQQADGMAAVAQSIAADANVKQALRAGDAGRLLAAWRPVFETLRREHSLTHFYFFDKNRLCLLREHMPGSSCGDRNERFTALEAERTGKTASGIELGTLGFFTLRVVQPVFAGGRLVGYVELGKEVKDAVRSLPIPSGTQLAVVIRKASRDRQALEADSFTAGACQSCHTREADWNRLPQSVVIFASQGRLPDAFASWADSAAGERARGEPNREIVSDGKDWQVSATPLLDASGAQIGHLLVMRDVSAEKAAFSRLMALGGTAGAALLALLLGFIYVLLRRTDAGIGAQQDALRGSEERYRTLVESALDGIVIHVGDRVAFANRAAAAMLGFAEPAALVGQPLASFVHLDDLASAADRVRRVLAGEAVAYPVEVRYVKRDGTELPVENTGALVSYKGKPAILSVIRDITEHKRTEDALKNSLSLVEATLETTDNGILVVNPEGAVVKANRRFAEMWRIPGDILASGDDERLLNHVLSQLSDPDAFVAKVKELYGDPVAETADLLYFKDGRVFERTSKPMLVGGEPTARVWSFLDVTDRKRAEKALRASEEEYRGLTEHINLGIYRNTVGPEGKFVEANPAIVEMFGYGSKAGFLAMNVSDLYRNPEDRKAFNDKMLKEGFVRGEELWLKKKDGSLFVASVSAVAVKDEQGHVEYFDGIIDNITERKRTEEALRESEERFRTLYEDSTIGIYRTTPDGKIQLANPALIRMLGYSSFDDLSTRRVVEQDYEPSYPHQQFVDVIERDGEVKGLESAWKRKDGTTFFARESARAIRDAHGNTLYYDGTIEDITERKQSEEALAHERFLLRALLNNVPDHVYFKDRDSRLIRISKALAQTFGMSDPAQAIGKTDFDFFTEEHARQAREDELAIMRTGQPANKEERETWAGRPDTWVSTTKVPLRDEEGNVVGTFGISRDITERKHAEEALRESEARYRRITEGLTDYQYTVRVEDGRAVETTQGPACASVTGYTAEEYTADPYLWIQMVTPEDRDRVRAHTRLILAGEDVPSIEHRIVRKDGAVRWVGDTAIPHKDASGRLLSYDGVISDITARRRAEEELQKLASVVRYSSELVNLSTLEGKMIFLNEAGSGMLGISPAEVERFNIMQVIPAHLKEKVETELLPTVMGAGTWAGELQYLNLKTGRLTDVHAMTFIVRDPATGAPLYLANVSLDITDRKRAEEEVRRKAKDLQEKNDELTRFTYAVSHDLRSPLVTIQMFQGYLEQDVRSQDAARIEKDLRYIRNAADKMGLLLDELLRLSRVGRVTNPPEEAPLQSIVKEALDLVAGRLTARGVRVEVTEEPVALTGDRTRLVEVFQNLVDNATKFMGDEPAPRVEIGVEQAGEGLVLFVRDNGIGIEPQLQPLVFDLFRKLDAKTDGVGIGLALVRRIVEVHGGRIWVESEGLGKGTTFRLTLAQTTWKRD